MREKGILNQIFQKYESPQQICPNYSGKPIGFESCFTAFLVLLSGLGLSLSFGIVEMINGQVGAQKSRGPLQVEYPPVETHPIGVPPTIGDPHPIASGSIPP
jgi:hypothetical protein